MTVLDLNTGGTKRKRHARDDGFRVPIVQPSYSFDGARDPTQKTVGANPSRYHGTTRVDEMLQPTCRASKNEHIRSMSERTVASSKHEPYLPKGPSSARTEFRAASLLKEGRQRASSIYSSRSSIGGREGTEKLDGHSKSSTPTPLSRHFSVTSRSSATVSRSSSSTSLLPPHLRPTALREEDSLSAERYASSLRLLATWESIALKYADVDPEDDAEIDIATGRIVKGKDKIAEMPDRVIGGMSDEEEAEEFRRKGKPSAKATSSTPQAPLTSDHVEHIISPVLPLTLDTEEVDFSDKDELDAWNDDELEIQVEALPPSHTSRSRHQRPWTADDDVDLREFLKAEERRKAMFGEEEEEEAESEEESRSHVGRTLDKEEAMSRRTVHASVPYFSSETPQPISTSSNRSKGSDPSRNTEASTRPSSRREVISAIDSEDEYSAEDELAGMLETPERLQNTRVHNRHSAADHHQSSSPLVLDMLSVGNIRQSSPSSASSHLNRHSTEGLSSSGEGETTLGSRRIRRSRRAPDMDEEELCEQQLLHISSQDQDQEHANDCSSDGDALIVQSHPINKANAWQDEGRCTSDNVVEVVIEVPNDIHADADTTVHADVERLSATGTGPRRSSRHAATGKSYALRKKRNKPSRLRREDTPIETGDIDTNRVCVTDTVSAKLPAPPLEHTMLQSEPGNSPGMLFMELPDTLQDDDANPRRSRSRSLSVVEGTPEPSSPVPYEHESFKSQYIRANILQARDLPSSKEGEDVLERSVGEKDPAEALVHRNRILQPPSDDLPGPDPILQSPTVSNTTSPPNITDTDAIASDDARTGVAPAKSGPEHAERAIDPTLSSSVLATHDEDDEDILLLGATFGDEEEIIWPEMKPDLAQAAAPPVEPAWPNTSCEMSFRSIKGEKQEMTTFAAPFRCSRIIDLTTDDLCDEDEHDELDEW